jgi:pyridoxamine 5'-phosphate oxidase family protein
MARNRSRRAPVRVPGFGLDPEKGAAISFTDEEIAYLRSQPIARVATVSADGQPDVVPLAFEFDGTFFWVGGSGATVLDTRKVRNVRAGRHKVALVIDDLVSFDPFIARGIRIYGDADPPVERVGTVGPGVYMRITPTISWSWNMAGNPVGDTWYEARRTVHQTPTRTC